MCQRLVGEGERAPAVRFTLAVRPSVGDRRPGRNIRQRLGLDWSVAPIHPNCGKALIGATFQNVDWIAEISVWDTGETELAAVRLRDDPIINKHYDLADIVDLDTVIDELLGLLRDGDTPPAAFIP